MRLIFPGIAFALVAAAVALAASAIHDCPNGAIVFRSLWRPLECHAEAWPPGKKIWCNCAAQRAEQTGQSQWCWVEAQSSVAFCDYSSFGSCLSANRGKQGTCVPRGRG